MTVMKQFNFEFQLRIILNKADSVDTPQLMRVHGALMWSLGKALQCPEVAQVYMGSFWDQPLVNVGLKDIFEKDKEALKKVPVIKILNSQFTIIFKVNLCISRH